MRGKLWVYSGVGLFTFLYSTLVSATDNESQQSIEKLESHLAKIDTNLENTARLSLRRGMGNIGWMSRGRKDPSKSEWAEITLSSLEPFDRIALVPTLWNDAEKGPMADGFPEAFRIIAGNSEDRVGKVIGTYDQREEPFLPRIAPLILSFPPTSASWIRIESIRLKQDSRNENVVKMKLAEVMVFSGEKNIALKQPVKVSSISVGWGDDVVSERALVDGLTPYLMDTAQNTRSNSFLVASAKSVPFKIAIDLEEPHYVEGIRLHGAELSEFIPQIRAPDFGMPTRIIVYGGTDEDFSESSLLLDYSFSSIYEIGNILQWDFPKIRCRYIWLSIPENAWSADSTKTGRRVSLAEIEIIAQEKNVALGKKVVFTPKKKTRKLFVNSLTDGCNHFGAILPIREWIEQLARRHNLEQERPLIARALQQRYDEQKSRLRLMTWLVSLLVGSLIIIVLVDRMLRCRALMKVRERLAANLHDELSANLHAIVLLGDLAEDSLSEPEELKSIIQKIQRVANRNRDHARHCMQQLQADSFVPDLETAMRRTANRILSKLSHDLSFSGQPFFKQLSQRKKNDLFLFYQECLVNIARHARATSLYVRLEASAKRMRLTVSDDGSGIDEIPPSLNRRARLLKATVRLEPIQSRGSSIILVLKLRKKIFANLFNRKPS